MFGDYWSNVATNNKKVNLKIFIYSETIFIPTVNSLKIYGIYIIYKCTDTENERKYSKAVWTSPNAFV